MSSRLLIRLIEEYLRKESASLSSEALIAAHGLLVTLRMPFTIVWSSRHKESFGHQNILLTDFVKSCCAVFSSSYRIFAEEWLEESIRWAADGQTTAQLDNRALELQSCLIQLSKSHSWGLELLQKKVIEAVLTITQPHSAAKVLDVLHYHATLIDMETDQARLIANPHLFWTAVGLLNVPFDVLPALYRQALSNCRAFLEKVNFTASGQTPDSPFFAGFKKARQSEDFFGIQPLLLQVIIYDYSEFSRPS